ncbi:E3 orf2 9.6kDa protein [Human adenovirus D9]|uniref:E3 orf2 9.6kDa protein n=1 Tax=Human adenovirus D serotype 9 TaxID=10527 RepID=Q5TIZ3_ADE09|nr:E3 orf2 9.6kDa protein [Human adenovirus D9]
MEHTLVITKTVLIENYMRCQSKPCFRTGLDKVRLNKVIKGNLILLKVVVKKPKQNIETRVQKENQQITFSQHNCMLGLLLMLV